MTLLDWLIVIIPTVAVLALAVYSMRYVHGVVDFLSAGRLCGRYVLLAGDMANGISILHIALMCEMNYKAGFAVGIWGGITIPISLTLGLFGYTVYRFRETKAQSFGQFIEMRYGSKGLRVYSCIIRTIAEISAHAIMPAIAGRFFLYFLGFPQYIYIFGCKVSVFVLIMSISMAMAVFIICCGGQISLVITDAIQGMFCLPLIVLFSVFLLSQFSWTAEVAPVLLDHVPGESFVNPYDVLRIRDFNLLTLILGVLTMFLHAAAWSGGGAGGSAITPHEQKMASILGRWRGFFSPLLYLLMSLTILIVLNHQHFSKQAKEIRTELSSMVACDIVRDNPKLQQELIKNISAIPRHNHVVGVSPKLSDEKNLDTVYIDVARKTFEQADPIRSASLTQQFKTVYYQTMIAVTMRKLLSPGMMGLFCLLAVLAMVSTDDSYMFSSVLTIVQDLILPFFKKPPSVTFHLWMFRIVAVLVGVYQVLCSTFMAQLDYIQLFVTIVLTTWLGGCGPVCMFGLYGRFGTRQGAWSALISGLGLSVTAIWMQRYWADTIYPFLKAHEWVEPVGAFLDTVSKPLNPLVVWKMNPEKCPINSFEFYFMIIVITLVLYLVVSWFTCKEPFNLDRMLHRGIYNTDGMPTPKIDFRLKNLLHLIAGITDEHTRGDRIISYSLVVYSYGYSFFCCFLLQVIWNTINRWPDKWWTTYFLINSIIIPTVAVAITSFWFGIGGVIGIVQLFKRLQNRIADPLDNGMVSGGISLSDAAKFKELEEKAKK